ncbi:hypothetical protein BO79DRAFT_253710 [Aspergillus costaricaensis CBS 115574]|uniref:Uncharacterized protein n=1 Tax=Aspergillus costaricaensis CBS 115574 TaxID=1448317 RepID=A0ACD1IKL5_9EURO|nr:hypothetical protein BO79DRAFT_253710 [Aspergillus costaricaensis CBS 115574]RAK90293.1 hypothetical protein BO79DRAFT_253710 [Aspergillus costaricaensis CBS 115574]
MSTSFISFPPIQLSIQDSQKPTRTKDSTIDLLAELEILAVTINNEDNDIILETASTNQYYKHTTHPLTILHPRDKNSTFLVKLEGLLSTPSQVLRAIQVSHNPHT